MIRFLAAHGFTPDETGALFHEAFGVGPRHQALATAWQTHGMGVNENSVNRLVSEGIREAERAAAIEGTNDD